MQVLDVNAWEREIAEGEAVRVLETVREAICSGRGSCAALQEVRRRMSRLSVAQRDLVIDELLALPVGTPR